MAQPRFGQLLWQAVQQVKVNKGRSITAIKLELAELCHVGVAAVEKWKKRSLPQDEQTLEELARWGVKKAGMKREWFVSFLRAAESYDDGTLEGELFEQQGKRWPTIRDNLPPLRSDFIGRVEEIGRVCEGLAMPHPLISIEGIGGVGKSTLALKVARMCQSGEIRQIDLARAMGQIARIPALAPPRWEAIVWISAKDKPDQDLSLDEVLDTIAGVLDYSTVRQLEPSEKRATVDRLLRSHRSLVIVDNFETVSDIRLADFLQRVPPPSKAIITTRERQLRRLWDVPLYGLSEREALQKIRDYSYSLSLRGMAGADEASLQPLVAMTQGNPKALEMALGYLKHKGMALDEVVRSLTEANQNVEELFHDLFARSWGLLSPEGRHLLMVMPFFADSTSREALEAASQVHGWYLRMGISQLLEMSLLETNEELLEARQRYAAHPLVLAFARARLREEPEFEAAARQRWCDFFLDYAEEYGDDDFGEAIEQERRQKLQLELNNLRLSIEWCLQEQSPKAARLVERLSTFLHQKGYWSERIELCRRTLPLSDSPESQAGLLTRMGWSYLWQGSYQAAREAFDRALSLARQHGLQKREVQLLRYSGQWHTRQGAYSDAERLYRDSLALAEELQQQIAILLVQAFRARTAYARANYAQAKQLFLDLLPKFKKQHPRQILFALGFLAELAIREEQLSQARAYLQKAWHHAETSPYQAHDIAKLHRIRGDLERAANNPPAALDAYQKALDLSTRLGMKESQELEALIEETRQ